MQPERKQLCTAFNKLRKLFIHGIFIKFDLLWTLNLIEAAPSVETFDVDVLLLNSFKLLVGMYTGLSDSKHHRSLFMIVHLWLNADV